MTDETVKIPGPVLVVEDDEALRGLIVKLLTKAGHDAVGCSNGAEALERIMAAPPVALLLDQSLPDMTGRQLLEALAKQGVSMPFIVMTGQGDERLAVEMMKLGASDYLVKDTDFLDFLPVAVERLFKAVDLDRNLRSEQKRLKAIATSARDAIVMMAADGSIGFWNPAAERIFGYSQEAALGKPLHELLAPERYHAAYNEAFPLFQATGQGAVVGRTIELEGRRADGREVSVELSLSSIQLDDGWHAVGVMRDITERKQAEEERERLQAQLLQAQKMESVGILAGGVAHDFNNLLQTMRGNIELLLHGKPEDHPDAIRLNTVTRSMDRAAQLVSQLLLFGRKARSRRMRVDMNQEVEGVARMLERTIPKMIALELRLAPSILPLFADPVQIEQALLNLARNASDAMPEGGKLMIKTSNAVLDEAFVRDHPDSTAGPHVLLTVSDTGCGMDKKTLAHIYDPFFTTKELGKGTGLGLASVYGIVRSHGGHVQCSSELGQGTTFKVYLPAMEQGDVKQGDVETVKPQLETPPRGGSETILAVDDDSEVRELTKEALELVGYAVKKAASGEEALDMYKNEGESIDLILLDLNMPGMGGHKCLQELLRLDPNVKVIIASGYTAKGQGKDVLATGARGFIGKPYRLKELAAMVRGALDEQAPEA